MAATQRSYFLHWDTPVALNPDAFTLHKADLMNASAGWMYLVAKYPQVSVGVMYHVWLAGPGWLSLRSHAAN